MIDGVRLSIEILEYDEISLIVETGMLFYLLGHNNSVLWAML